MSFDTRCPECGTKLRLEEAPEAGESIECPKCGHVYEPVSRAARNTARQAETQPAKREKIFADDDDDDARPSKNAARRSRQETRERDRKQPVKTKVKKTEKASVGKSIAVKADKNPNNKGKKRSVRKKRTNPAVLLVALACGFLSLAGVFFGMTYLLGRAGGVTEMLGFVPAEANWIRGVNVSFMAKFPGYADQVNKFRTGEVDSAVSELARTSGIDEDRFLDYLMIAKIREGRSTSTMYLMRTQKSFDQAKIQEGLKGGRSQSIGGMNAVQFDDQGPGILSKATLMIPTSRLVIVIQPGPKSSNIANTVAGAKSNPDTTFAKHINSTTKTIIRGSIWLILRKSGDLENYMDASLVAVNTDFKTLYERGRDSQISGVWTSPGASGVRVGAAIQCADSTQASELVKYMKEGPLGKEDESEPTNQMKSAGIFFLLEKRTFGEFMQYLEFRYKNECAYIVSTLSGENAKRVLDAFNNPTMGSELGFQPTAGGGGGGGAPPPPRGLPGGIATPGMGP